MDENRTIETQEEYDEELEKFNKELKELGKHRNIIRADSYAKFNILLNRAERIGLFPPSYIIEIRQRIIDGINNPALKEKAKKYLRKVGVLKE